jgi:ABC-type lipoprotein export system ATPase subunit
VELNPVLEVADLTRRFQRGSERVTALDRVSLYLYPGQLTVAAGPSGSGKTTLLSVIAGYETADTGRVVTYPPLPTGVPVDRLGWRHVAFVPQSLVLLDELTVRENLEIAAMLDAGPAVAEPWSTDTLLAALEIDHLAERYPSQTSGGEQQRTALARALCLRPTLLLADEPTGHQDSERIDLVLGVLREHAYRGNTVLISSHDEAVITAADRVLPLADGRLLDPSAPGVHLTRP